MNEKNLKCFFFFSGLSRYCLSSAKNCEDHTHSFQSAVLIHEIHLVFNSMSHSFSMLTHEISS